MKSGFIRTVNCDLELSSDYQTWPDAEQLTTNYNQRRGNGRSGRQGGQPVAVPYAGGNACQRFPDWLQIFHVIYSQDKGSVIK